MNDDDLYVRMYVCIFLFFNVSCLIKACFDWIEMNYNFIMSLSFCVFLSASSVSFGSLSTIFHPHLSFSLHLTSVLHATVV